MTHIVILSIHNSIAVTHIVNLSIQTSTFPTLWKHAKVIPLFKRGSEDQFAPKSYRPVALLPVISKVFEKAVFSQLVDLLEKNNLILSLKLAVILGLEQFSFLLVATHF